ncbi:MAG TPA: contact-dependent growth inhibition system immunity protein [Verrucomicrobiae bacterium]
MQFDRSKSILQLTREKFRNRAWDFDPFPSGYYLRNLPLDSLTEEHMWILIRQSIGLDYLVLLAIEKLEENPLLKSRRTEGDLLSAVLCADALVWKRNPHYRQRVTKLWSKASVKLLSKQSPEIRALFGDYRWFVKAGLFLPAD